MCKQCIQLIYKKYIKMQLKMHEPFGSNQRFKTQLCDLCLCFNSTFLRILRVFKSSSSYGIQEIIWRQMVHYIYQLQANAPSFTILIINKTSITVYSFSGVICIQSILNFTSNIKAVHKSSDSLALIPLYQLFVTNKFPLYLYKM